MAPLLTIFSSIQDVLKKWDTYLFLKINKSWTNPLLDSVYPWWRDSITWVPLYVFLLAYMLMNFGRKAWPWLLFALFTITVADQVSSSYIKHYFARPRPCNDVWLQFQVRLLLQHCGSGYSFTSSHATNHFAMAMFFSQTLKNYVGKYDRWFFVWAATVAYGQVYVGVHYPLDVLGGAVLGCGIGYMVAALYHRMLGGLPKALGQSVE